MATVYGNMGDVYRIQSNLPKAIDYIAKSLKLAEETGDQKKAADGYIGMATVYYEIPGKDSITLAYLDKARKIYEALGDEAGLSFVYGNLSAVYLDQDDFDKALFFSDKTMALQKKLGKMHGLATSLHNRAIIRSYQGRYAEALADFEQEIEIFEAMGDQEGLADAYIGMGDLWLQQQRSPMAIQACSKALRIARSLGGPNQEEMYACDCLYTAYQVQGNYRQALEYLEQSVRVKDSLQQYETEQKLRQMEIRRQMSIDSLGREKENFRIEMAHQQALRRKDQNLSLLTVGALCVLLVAFAFLVRMLYFRRKTHLLQLRSDELEKQQLLNEVALLRSQVNPHFLFNSLNSLSSLIRSDPDEAEVFLDEMSDIYRYLLRKNSRRLVTLQEELEFAQSYLQLLKKRYGMGLHCELNISEAYHQRLLPPLTLQLLIENAVKHNVVSRSSPLYIRIFTNSEGCLTVSNNLQEKKIAVESNKVGLSNISANYKLLNQPDIVIQKTDQNFSVILSLIEDPDANLYDQVIGLETK